MNIIVAYDGSDDAFAGLKLAAEVLLERGSGHKITLTVVGWPPRLSPIWDKAFNAHAAFDDLHRAMATVADMEFKRLRSVFEAVGEVETYFGEGVPASEIAALARRKKADLVLVGATRGRHHEAVQSVIEEALQDMPCPTFVAHGPAPKR